MQHRVPPQLLLAELARRQAMRAEREAPPPALFDSMFAQQRAFCDNTARELALLCSRRSGKSWGVAARLIKRGWKDPGGLSVYIARSKGDARLLIWPDVMDKMNHSFNLGLRLREVDNQLMVFLPNGHRIWLSGCKDSSEIGKFRGKKYQTVVVDECQELPFLEELISESLHHALVDKQGDLILAGTPGPVPAGLFYQVTTGDGGNLWPMHSWTVFDNPNIPENLPLGERAAGIRSEYERYKERYGVRDDTPKVVREWFGRWVRDLEALVAPFDSQLNSCRRDALPEGKFDYAVIVDLGAGAQASTAFVVMAQHRSFPETYILSAEKKADMIPSKVAAYAEHLCRQCPTWPQLIVDEGGLGKGYADEMRKTYGLNAVAAEKSKKRAYLELFYGELRSGSIKLDPYTCRPLVDEMQLCQWTADKSEIDDRFEDHAIMAAVYGARALRPNYRPQIEKDVDPEREWAKAQAAKRAKAMRKKMPWVA